jgi:hypothetical protein
MICPQSPPQIITVDEHRTRARDLCAAYYADPAAMRFVQLIYERDFSLLGYLDDLARALEPPQRHSLPLSDLA